MPTEYFEQRERALLGPRYEQLYAAPQQTAARGVTVSALRTTPEQFAQRADFPLEPSPFCKAAFVVHQPDFKPGRHPYHHAGVFYSQEPSASSAAPLLGVQPGMRVLDLCAAPGGKSSQLAAALQGRGVLVSNEYVAARAEILKSNLERMGVSNAVVLNETPARIAEALPEFFDRVLVDAPCSGEGMFRKEPVALQQHCEALVKQCAELGAQILDCAAAALAPGGQLVYSTCTTDVEENEKQVLFAREELGLELEPLGDMPGFDLQPPQGCEGVWCLSPKMGDTQGFFVARLRKSGRSEGPVPYTEHPVQAEVVSERQLREQGLDPRLVHAEIGMFGASLHALPVSALAMLPEELHWQGLYMGKAGKNASPIQYAWKALMEDLQADLPVKEFAKGENVVEKHFDTSTGAIISGVSLGLFLLLALLLRRRPLFGGEADVPPVTEFALLPDSLPEAPAEAETPENAEDTTPEPDDLDGWRQWLDTHPEPNDQKGDSPHAEL